MKKLFLLVLLGFAVMIPFAFAGSFNESLDVSDIIDDGIARNTIGVGYTNVTATVLYMGQNVAGTTIDRGWVVWNISDIPIGATITDVYFQYDGQSNNQDGNITAISINADVRPASEVYWAIGNGTIIYDTAGFPVVGNSQELEFNAAAVTTLQNALDTGKTYFTIGFIGTNEAVANTLSAIESTDAAAATPDPTLVIEFNYPYQYHISSSQYENGTHVWPPFNVTVTGISINTEFNTTTNTVQGFTTSPEAFFWGIGGGYTRYIYSVGSENLTITYPDGTDYTYTFTIKDLTGNVGSNSYLEAYRTINGTETLITRMPIEQPNAVPMNLVFGRTYRLKILLDDGTRYDWGYFIPGSDTTNTLIIRQVEFTDQAQIIYNDIHVEAARPTATTITVDYLDDREHTTWANVTIRERNGPIVLSATRSNNSYTINYAPVNASLGYVVTVTGYHTDYGTWGRSFILDQTYTFPDAPSLSGIFGDVSGDLLGFFAICVVILMFPPALQPMGLFAGCIMASGLTYLGWTSYTYDWLAFAWFVSTVVNLIAYRMGRFT